MDHVRGSGASVLQRTAPIRARGDGRGGQASARAVLSAASLLAAVHADGRARVFHAECVGDLLSSLNPAYLSPLLRPVRLQWDPRDQARLSASAGRSLEKSS